MFSVFRQKWLFQLRNLHSYTGKKYLHIGRTTMTQADAHATQGYS